MATEFVYYGSQELCTEDLITFISQAIEDSVVMDSYVRREGLTITPWDELPGEEGPTESVFGFPNNITITFRLGNRASRETKCENIVTILRVVLGLLDTHPGAGVLLLNDSYVVLQQLNGGLIVNSQWEDLKDIPKLKDHVANRELRPLLQPLLDAPRSGAHPAHDL